MGRATLLGACLTGLQGLRGPLGWEHAAEAAGTNNVVSKATGVDMILAHREPAPPEPEKTVRRHFYHVLSLTMQR